VISKASSNKGFTQNPSIVSMPFSTMTHKFLILYLWVVKSSTYVVDRCGDNIYLCSHWITVYFWSLKESKCLIPEHKLATYIVYCLFNDDLKYRVKCGTIDLVNPSCWRDTQRIICLCVCVVALLTVKFRQPRHEFTFGVGMTFIYYAFLLTPLV
jgi:hypothetical protein